MHENKICRRLNKRNQGCFHVWERKSVRVLYGSAIQHAATVKHCRHCLRSTSLLRYANKWARMYDDVIVLVLEIERKGRKCCAENFVRAKGTSQITSWLLFLLCLNPNGARYIQSASKGIINSGLWRLANSYSHPSSCFSGLPITISCPSSHSSCFKILNLTKVTCIQPMMTNQYFIGRLMQSDWRITWTLHYQCKWTKGGQGGRKSFSLLWHTCRYIG